MTNWLIVDPDNYYPDGYFINGPGTAAPTTIETSIFAGIVADPVLSGIIGTRCFPLRVPNGSLFPAMCYLKIDGNPEMGHGGPPGFEIARFQFSLVAETYKSAKSLAATFESFFDGFVGNIGGGSYVQGSTLLVNYDGDPDPDQTVFEVFQDYRVPFRENETAVNAFSAGFSIGFEVG